MIRAPWLLILAAAALGCSGGSETPGAVLRGPGALAVFDGIIAHGTGSLRPYLAVANERGDELRLIDTTDNQVVTSPGLVYPLSIPLSLPSSSRPLFVAAAHLNDDAKPDALVVIAAGSSVVELVDTWSGQPTVISWVDLATLAPEAEILSLTGAAVPGGPAGVARFLVGLSGKRLAVLEASRAGDAITLEHVETLALGFDAISLSQGGAPELYVYAATRDLLPNDGVHGVARLDLPLDLAGWSVTALDAHVPTDAVAVARFDSWVFPTPGVAPSQPDTWVAAAGDTVIAVPDASSCGAPPKPIRCGLLALDGAGLVANVQELIDAGEEPHRLPIPIPSPVTGILAAGRAAASLMPIASGAGTVNTTGVAAVSAADGRIYLVDLARWSIASDTSPLVGTGKTGAAMATATVIDADSSAIGLWKLAGTSATLPISAQMEDVAGRVRVTPGFTPDDTWTLSWKAVLAGLETRAALLWRDASDVLWLSVQIGQGATAQSVARLDLLGVTVGDSVEVPCADGSALSLSVAEVITSDIDAPGEPVRLTPPASGCLGPLGPLPPAGSTVPVEVVATFRASGFMLAGGRSGHAGRPGAFTPTEFVKAPDGITDTSMPTDYSLATNEFKVPGSRRLFYVTDSCLSSSECAATWKNAPYIQIVDTTLPVGDPVKNGLGFPLPSGPVVGLLPGFVDTNGLPTPVEPPPGTAIHFSTRSGLAPSGRRPIVKGTALDSALPTGLALVDGGASGAGADVYASFTAGVVMRFSTAAAPGAMAVIR